MKPPPPADLTSSMTFSIVPYTRVSVFVKPLAGRTAKEDAIKQNRRNFTILIFQTCFSVPKMTGSWLELRDRGFSTLPPKKTS